MKWWKKCWLDSEVNISPLKFKKKNVWLSPRHDYTIVRSSWAVVARLCYVVGWSFQLHAWHCTEEILMLPSLSTVNSGNYSSLIARCGVFPVLTAPRTYPAQGNTVEMVIAFYISSLPFPILLSRKEPEIVLAQCLELTFWANSRSLTNSF